MKPQAARCAKTCLGEEVYFLDSDILERLTREALEAERQTLLAEGWKWVEVGGGYAVL